MWTVLTTEAFDTWFSTQRDQRAARRIQGRATSSRLATSATPHRSARAPRECGSTTDPATGSASSGQGREVVVLRGGGDEATQDKGIAKACGMTTLAREAGLTREGLYKALAPNGNPEFATVMKVIRALGLHLHGSVAQG